MDSANVADPARAISSTKSQLQRSAAAYHKSRSVRWRCVTREFAGRLLPGACLPEGAARAYLENHKIGRLRELRRCD